MTRLLTTLRTSLLLPAIFLAGGAGAALAQAAPSAWNSQCISPSRKVEGICTASHRVSIQETGQTLFMIELRTRPDTEVTDFILTGPTGFYLPDGIGLAVDGTGISTPEVTRCDPNSCYAQVDLTAEDVAAMKKGKALQLRFSPSRGNSQTIEISLAGFTAAYDGIAR
ncbi:invasion associated locus B family protein [Celeribacter indicus]|uniref:Invasion associated locus B family protein n=1 Tax=Celeribacter indicus TaxID=1208324 RepID=A0A0B5E5U6_9RHOB|nr:invasion associated locus B family protein [Celeribacter indicus]AJE48391.1 Invasion associated locus B family protein [Celeribacter indicus]SDW74743.1 Invasion protein IalB, involved in pathogenesis [Celeribacter indicus]